VQLQKTPPIPSLIDVGHGNVLLGNLALALVLVLAHASLLQLQMKKLTLAMKAYFGQHTRRQIPDRIEKQTINTSMFG
jgi:hypothetical protein